MPVSKKRPGGSSAKRKPGKRSAVQTNNQRSIAIYHVMYANEDFEKTADILFQLVKDAAQKFPGKPRALFFDIDGHRNKAGGFDGDSYEVQKNYLLGYLGRWLTRISMPLGVYEKQEQHEDIPDHLTFIEGGESEAREQTLREIAQEPGRPVYDSETGEWVDGDGKRAGG